MCLFFCVVISFVFLSNYLPLMCRAKARKKARNCVCKMSLEKNCLCIECAVLISLCCRLKFTQAVTEQCLVYSCDIGGAKNDGHENNGPSKLQGMKLQDMKLQDMTRIEFFNFSFFFLYCDADVAAMELCNVIMK